ncbi:riboflavin synthase subunit alpha [Paenibacillus darwinianus]|uniref:Riboflavin synthase n=1 Tax=Paenibacillus darwinianus TaxID=1380763 RepID=A0A9W5W741_9BACL|nr:riboflavin synthase [Paenibacillus darwinianus]EXX88249.1 riboflavin synthase subunit alpha [Paenibacillus darwinianus]EXX88576.1 riboflavin synthase subunit alpha [Paenibacillus darwinianus]EXX91767.1 riboflavin synthase subunit alpha [Paenibacillus darwinianus]
MFTGLIEEIGKLRRVARQGEALVLEVEASLMLEEVKLGDSIAINGVCLTVTSFDRRSFKMDVTPQTFRHSTLKDLKPGDPVNLERAMAAGGRFGGHIVQGHADGTAVIVSRKQEENAVWFDFRLADSALMRYIVPHGSVTIDGISLTVARTNGETFGVSIIPHTLLQTALQYKQAGESVNVECDILGKYVEHLLRYGPRAAADKPAEEGVRLSAAFLSDNGFL